MLPGGFGCGKGSGSVRVQAGVAAVGGHMRDSGFPNWTSTYLTNRLSENERGNEIYSEGGQPSLYTVMVSACLPPTLSSFRLLPARSAFFLNLSQLPSASAAFNRLLTSSATSYRFLPLPTAFRHLLLLPTTSDT